MPLPIVSVAQMREWEAATWASGQAESEVIRLVGHALARRVRQLTRDGESLLVLAGKGHNGDDARAALPHLQGRHARCLNVTDPEAQLGELDAALARRPALVLDALFGLGLNRPLDTAWQQYISHLNASHLPVLAVDVPSGLSADSGEPLGAAVQAMLTLTVGAPKQGLLRSVAWPFVGRLEVAEHVGLLEPPAAPGACVWLRHRDFAGFPPARAAAAHKGDFGHLAIVAGSPGYHGAAVLATRAAQRASAGLVTLHTLTDAYWPASAQLQGAMIRGWHPEAPLGAPFSAVLIGPGLASEDAAEQIRPAAAKLWHEVLTPVVVDASALDWLPQEPAPPGAIRVLTPHPGEAARLLDTSATQVQADRPAALREISRRFGNCWVVLKGHQTLIGQSTGELAVNSSGNPQLAQGGSGDVLAGYIAGLLAQPALQRDVARTLRYAVWQHGATADALSAQRPNWVVEELVTALGTA
jgi:NAD(P)H-hydrate epimerase